MAYRYADPEPPPALLLPATGAGHEVGAPAAAAPHPAHDGGRAAPHGRRADRDRDEGVFVGMWLADGMDKLTKPIDRHRHRHRQ